MEVEQLRKELIHTFVETGNTKILDDINYLDELMLKYFGEAWSLTELKYE